MKVLLDTSFLRHLELVNQLHLLEEIKNLLSWNFCIAQTVFHELQVGGISSQFQSMLDTNIVSIESCGNPISKVDSRALSLDPGELEIICIVDQCKDRTFKEYLILIDDHQAQKIARTLSMNSHDVLVFLFFCNQKNLLQKSSAMMSLQTIKSNNYHMENFFESDFEKRLI